MEWEGKSWLLPVLCCGFQYGSILELVVKVMKVLPSILNEVLGNLCFSMNGGWWYDDVEYKDAVCCCGGINLQQEMRHFYTAFLTSKLLIKMHLPTSNSDELQQHFV